LCKDPIVVPDIQIMLKNVRQNHRAGVVGIRRQVREEERRGRG